MGKFLTLIEAEQSGKRYQKTEAALHHAGFAHEYGSCCWERYVRTGDGTAVHAELNLYAGMLGILSGWKNCSLEAPAGVLENDDAQALMQWLDGVLEEWL